MIKVGTRGFDDRKKDAMSRLRVFLGICQTAGVICTLTLLLRTSVNTVSLGSTVVTCLLTSVSVLVFGSHINRRR